MKLAVAVVALAACRHGGSTAKPAPTRTPYLSLFEANRTWSAASEVTTATRAGEAWATAPAQRGTVSCRIAEVKQVGDANVSRVACEPPHEGLLVVGTWVATPAGLYHPLLPVDDVDELALLGDDDLLIAAVPKERAHDRAMGHARDSVEAFAFDGSWCVRNSTAAAEDHRSYTLCFGDAGVTGGGELVVSGATLTRVRFGASPDDPDDPTRADE